ncbi:hypothetical protein AAG570_011297 [Ranatra chinensis]|uniref:ditrans,polycis-polyprenyl diphosphate synthase [(2E,6E)-farnesyldiphosphate specific] n=1 Tax=Ranatra chinensis TaxID=642074 RepID=A0ABD0Z8I4_9HEMI
MVLIFGPETISYRDVARVIEWCFPAGVRVISFYDCQNGINSNLIFEAICKFSKPNVQNIKWGKSFSQDIKEESKKQINGYIWKPKLVVNVYKREDGLDSLLRIVEELHNSGVKNVDQNTLGELMSKRISAPDPDLAVICGQAMSYFGFLPWHLRITQFL